MSIGTTGGGVTSGLVAEAVERIAESSTNRRRPRRTPAWAILVLVLALVYFVIPLYASATYGLSDGKHFTIQPLLDALAGSGFQESFQLSLTVALLTMAISVVIVAPTSYLIVLRFHRLRSIVDFVTILPFVIPPIILTVGLREVWGRNSPFGLNLVSSPVLLVCGYFVLALPFSFRTIDNAMRAIDVATLTEASQSLGAGPIRTFLSVILPGTVVGTLSAALLVFTTVMGEFTLASLLGYATFPVFLNNDYASDSRGALGLVLMSFVITWLAVLGLAVLGRRAGGRAATAGVR